MERTSKTFEQPKVLYKCRVLLKSCQEWPQKHVNKSHGAFLGTRVTNHNFPPEILHLSITFLSLIKELQVVLAWKDQHSPDYFTYPLLQRDSLPPIFLPRKS